MAAASPEDYGAKYYGVDQAKAEALKDDRRRLGAYYTSEHVAKALVEWALEGVPGRVLDPSYGGCAFLRVALEHLRYLGATNPAGLIHGTDIDKTTAPWRAHLVGQGVPQEQLLGADFLSIRPNVDMPKCRAVVGNPPYVRHHWLTAEQMTAYASLRTTYKLSARASTWAYFVLHAMTFVEPGGRIAFLLPGAVLHDGYAASVRKSLAETCRSVVLVRLREKLFKNALEETVVLLAQMPESDKEESATSEVRISYRDVNDVSALLDLLKNWPDLSFIEKSPVRFVQPHKANSLPIGAAEVIERCRNSESLRPLKELADLRIGVVTGANSFFVRALGEVPVDSSVTTQPVVSRAMWLDRPAFTDGDVDRLTSQGLKTQLIRINSSWRPSNPDAIQDSVLGSQVRRAEGDGIHERHYCAKREPWYCLTDARVPNAFLPYMGRNVPRPVLNLSHATCTNAVHRLYWLDEPTADQAFARVLSGWSSLWQVLGELSGRHYGGGVLKLEPRVAGTLPLLDPDPSNSQVSKILEKARIASNRGLRTAICSAADELVSNQLGLNASDISLLLEAKQALQNSRPQSKSSLA